MINFPIPSADGELFTDTDGVLWIADDADLPLQENVRWVRRGSAIGESLAIGAFMNFGGSTAPAGYLVCDGASYKKTDYPDLYAAIGDLWANTGSVVSPPVDEFRVPPQDVDGLGLYLRGDGSSTVVGEYQGDVFKEHSHSLSTSGTVSDVGISTSTSRFANQTSDSATYGSSSSEGFTNQAAINSTGGPTETRPRSITTLLCIKATFSSFTGDLGNIPVNSVGMPQLQDSITEPSMAGAGYVVESGSNANGSWTKWADGTMICTLTASLTITESTANLFGATSGAIFFANHSWSYPISFLSVPVITATSITGGVIAPAIVAITNVSSTVQCYAAGNGTNITFNTMAIGIWK